MPFSAFGLHPDILRGIQFLDFKVPTPIQAQAIGPAMEGRDVLACAATGSGKTAAFLLPTIHRLMTRPLNRRTTRALVLTPTRELALQILDHLNGMATHTPVSGATVIGGMSMGPQMHAFRTGTDILIATPGRLLDHLKQPYAKLDNLEILILDEADRMLDMGFLPDIRRILRMLPTKRQTLFFSATMPVEVRQLMHEMLKDPATIQIDRQAAPAAGITQAIYPVAQHVKASLLCKLLEHEGLESVICFTRTKHRANRLAATLAARGFSCAAIHGNRSQAQRAAALNGFKDGRHRVLVATDIAARGIDIAEVSHVINFDCPHVPEDYIHRVGRTGRASATGDAFTFVSPEEESDLRAIERAINRRLPRVTVPDFDYNQKNGEPLEIPLAQRIAAIRLRKAEDRARREARQSRGQQGAAGASGHKAPQRHSPGSSNGRSGNHSQGAPHAGNRSTGGSAPHGYGNANSARQSPGGKRPRFGRNAGGGRRGGRG